MPCIRDITSSVEIYIIPSKLQGMLTNMTGDELSMPCDCPTAWFSITSFATASYTNIYIYCLNLAIICHIIAYNRSQNNIKQYITYLTGEYHVLHIGTIYHILFDIPMYIVCISITYYLLHIGTGTYIENE